MTSGAEEIYDMLEVTIKEHKKTREVGSTPRDLIDVYLDAMKENENDPTTTFSMEQLMQVCSDLFAAGSESTSNSIAYAVLHMLRNPECQEKVQKELDEVIGIDQFASYNDKQRLPYTYAAITESFRMSPVAPISVPHFCTEDAKLSGYDIPKGTWALVNFATTNMDKKYWGDPVNFRPERFLDDNGKFVTSKLDHVWGFGAGKRQCLGEPLARISNFCLFTAVMQHFKFDLVPGMPKPPIDPIEGFTIAPKPFKAKVSIRS
jgi:cytochrome P450